MSKQLLLKLSGLILTVVLFAILLKQFDYQAFVLNVNQTGLKGLLAVLFLQFISQTLIYLQWFWVSRHQGCKVRFGTMVRINLQGTLTESITPGAKLGGEVVRVWLLQKLGHCSSAQAVSIVTAQKLFSMSAFVLINLFSWLYLARQFEGLGSGYLSYLVVPILIALILLMLFAMFKPGLLRKLFYKEKSKDTKVGKFFNSSLANLEKMSADRKFLVRQFLLSILIWLMYPIKMIALLHFMLPQVKISLILITAITFIAYMVAMLPLFPGGLGGFEATMTSLLVVAGLSAAQSAAAAMMFRFVTFWVLVLVGLIAYLCCKATDFVKLKSFIPNFLTLINLFIGLVVIGSLFYDSVNFSMRGAAFLILLAAAIDGVDGKVARKLNSVSELGGYLDSFADLISFCVAPAALIASTQFFQNRPLLGLLLCIYPIAGAYRLARYHVLKSADSFTGVPVTVSGAIIALYIVIIDSFGLFSSTNTYEFLADTITTFASILPLILHGFLPIFLTVILSGLMVCRLHIKRPGV